MKVKKLLKVVNVSSYVVIYWVGNSEPVFNGFAGNIPFYLTQMKMVDVNALGDDGYNRLSVVVERDEK